MILDFLHENFIRPIVEEGVAGYNIYNTIVYALLFALALFGVYKLLKKLKIAIDKKFLIGIFPFIILGSLFRVLRDANVFKHWIFVSPLIYFLVFFIALASLLFAIGVERLGKILKIQYEEKQRKAFHDVFEYHKIWFVIGLIFDVFSLILLLQIGFKNFFGAGLILLATALWSITIFGFYKLRDKIKIPWFNRSNASLLAVHMFDASTTFVALQFFPYYEQHVLSNVVIAAVGPIGQFLLKFPIVLLVLYFLERELKGKENENLRNFLKIAILILGFAPGLRNFLRLGFFV